ncbi:hypothetical protein AHMF7605_26085 [Adhaeribacter arboris]|uniref:Uncharacterized protein n=1 Tax=Adhaeribacter arboris TaxID=2072846 RepID=A0A2T2YMK2_9BACT|nr:hypothetical protein [Adhaeribacter arboris]PSR56715.1 hypothetical protein AHMF7605_26085 [Adhaeribacter arboris]
MKNLFLLLLFLPVFCSAQTPNYLNYHHQIIQAEEYLVARQFPESLKIYRQLTATYPHVFLRDMKVAAQLAAYTKDTANLYFFLEKAMQKGWTAKQILKRENLQPFKSDDRFQKLLAGEDQFHKTFENKINLTLRKEIKQMLAADQKRALRVALTPGKKWRQQYTMKKFVPQNRVQVRRINQIMDQVGYPGEKIIGDHSWATVLISHNEHDYIYQQLRPKLYAALKRGEISAIELAIVESWRRVVDTNGQEKAFVIWEQEVSQEEAAHADSLRSSIGLRSIALNNKLLDLEKELKMKFYLSPSHGGRIIVKP